MEINPFTDEFFMKEALKEARKAYQLGEVPVGAVVVCENQIIARAHNYTQTLNEEYFSERTLNPGYYTLKEEVFDGEDFLPEDTMIDVEEPVRPNLTAFGVDVYSLNIDNREVLIPGDYLNARL